MATYTARQMYEATRNAIYALLELGAKSYDWLGKRVTKLDLPELRAAEEQYRREMYADENDDTGIRLADFNC